MNKKELINAIAERSNSQPAKIRRLLDLTLSILTEELKANGSVTVLGFGRLYPIEQSARMARNPQKGIPVMIQPRTSVRFKPGKYLLDNLNNK